MGYRNIEEIVRTGKRLAGVGGLAIMLSACAGGGETGEGGDSGPNWLERQVASGATATLELAAGPGMLPSIMATIEETCVAQQVLAGNTDSLGGAIAIGAAAQILQQVIEEQTGRKPMFCDQNFVGMILTTDRLMVRSIQEVAMGMETANRALGGKTFDVPRTLQLFLASNGTSMTGMQSADIKTSIQFIGEAADAANVELQKRLDAGGLSEATALILAQSVRHLANASYLRGKLLVAGFIINRAITTIGGAQALVNVAAIDLTGLREDFLKDLPGNTIRLVDATFKTVSLISTIADVSNDDAFELAFEEAANPDSRLLANVAAEVAEIQTQFEDTDLPTIEEGAKSKDGYGSLLGGAG